MLNISMVGPLEVMLEIRECPPLMLKDVDGGPLGGAAGDPVAPTINEKNVDGRPPGPLGGSGLHPRSKRCVVNLLGYDRQKVILLTGPILPALIPIMAYNP
jgi:hypothetical protein